MTMKLILLSIFVTSFGLASCAPPGSIPMRSPADDSWEYPDWN